ncbi:hypothetical protein [Nocardia jiangxiensis]|uniref:hypothetical protein n=1 Tax=Nocardia jiangxiensis TaxID=282685 RepID=UPI0002F43073|nr:hypothetical protein [Nocardia jiangxiensis]
MMEDYLRGEMVVKAEMWGPTWERMRKTALWLAANGISFRWNDDEQEFDRKEEYGLPRLFIFTELWDEIEVRVGHYIVIKGYRDFTIVSKREFREEYKKVQAEAC